jgi:fimbrial chaperone protein
MKMHTVLRGGVWVFFLCLLLWGAAPAFALKLMPFRAVMQIRQANVSQVFRIENNSNEPAAIEVKIQTWDFLPDGSEVNTPADADFIVFPAQVVLAPGESRGVRVQWTGREKPVREKAYRLVAQQLPIDLKKMQPVTGPSLRIMVRFKAALYVRANPNAKSDLRITALTRGPDGKRNLIVQNKGDAHGLIRQARVRISPEGSGEIMLEGAAASFLTGINVHAGAERHIPLPAEVVRKLGSRAATAELIYEAEP